MSLGIALTMATSLAFGIAPAMLLTRAHASRALREAGRDGSLRSSRSHRVVVAAQVALTSVLLVTASLLGETVLRLSAASVGFDARRVILATVRYPTAPAVPAGARPARTVAVLERLTAVPGVTDVAAVSTAPFSGGSGSSSLKIEGRVSERDAVAFRQVVTGGYFSTLAIPVLKGRRFTSSDAPGSHVSVVSAGFERRYMDGDAVGKRFTLNGIVHDVVGVVGDTKHREYTDTEGATFYVLHRQLPNWAVTTFLVRVSLDPDLLVPTIRSALERHDSSMAVATVDSMERLLTRTIAEERYRALLSLIFAGAALLLSAVGIYGVAVRSVTARVREFGVRSALGASPTTQLRLVLAECFRLVAAGLTLGLLAAFGATRFVESLLFGVTSTASHTFVIVSVVLGIVALVGSAVPAYRASRIDPVVALREG